MQVFDCSDESVRDEALIAAASAVQAGELVVLPTDTVYGLAADAFNPAAVQRLLDAKGRGRDMPPPVLIGAAATLEALVVDIQPWLREVIGRFWPGPLTVICRQQPTLSWDLGETYDTVAVRVPDHEVAALLLKHTGPLAVSSANTTSNPAALTIEAAQDMLGDLVSVYLDAGALGDNDTNTSEPSTILDTTSQTPRLLREGPISLEQLREFNNTIESRGKAQAESD